jgi:hypothetical protein
LTDDFTFTSPYYDAIGKAVYFEGCWPNSERIRTHLLEKIFKQGSEAFVQASMPSALKRQARRIRCGATPSFASLNHLVSALL